MEIQIHIYIMFLCIVSTYPHRERRYIFINPTSPITLGFILNLPIALALPTLVYDGRSLDAINRLDTTNDSADELFYDIGYSESLGRLRNYFTYMEIPTLSCQERLICELAADPDAYSPMTDLILRELRQKYGPVKKTNDSLIWRYMASAKEGFSSTAEECGSYYSKCPVAAYKLLNMPVIKVWQYLSSKLNIKLVH